jgi:hypothetical protein
MADSRPLENSNVMRSRETPQTSFVSLATHDNRTDISGSQPEPTHQAATSTAGGSWAGLVGVVGQVGENPLSIILPRARDRFREMALIELMGWWRIAEIMERGFSPTSPTRPTGFIELFNEISGGRFWLWYEKE